MKTTRTIKYCGLKAKFDEQRMTLTFDNYGSDDEGDFTEDLTVPVKYEVCGSCDGRGTTTRHIERDGGGFTASEWAEECYEDPDFADDYFGGEYDRDCPDCNGKRVAPEIELTNFDPRMKRINEMIKDENDYRACVNAERRMGA